MAELGLGGWLQPSPPEFESPFPLMSWKDEMHTAACEYLNKHYHVNASEVISIYDHAWTYENSLGGCDAEYECNIYYKCEGDNRIMSVTYQGTFSSLVESLSS